MMRMAYQNHSQSFASAASASGVAPALRAEAARANLSGREIARRLNVSAVYVSRRLSGEVECTATDLQRFAALLDVPVAVFFGEESSVSRSARRKGRAA